MKTKNTKPKRNAVKQKCGLCGKARQLTETECCANWICDDEDKYVAFSYARNSCHRNHSHYTLCAYHHNEGHSGNWQACTACENDFETEMYVWYGTNEYNFTKLSNPPVYEPTKCTGCGIVIDLANDGYSEDNKQYFCEECGYRRMKQRLARASDSEN